MEKNLEITSSYFSAPSIQKHGCYFIDQDMHSDRLLPLTSLNCHINIVNSISNITLAQTYQNPTNKFLEIYYSFPINSEACIYQFTAQFGKTMIEGIVKEKEKAMEEYKEAKNEGRKVAYGDLDHSDKSSFNLKIGNVPPN